MAKCEIRNEYMAAEVKGFILDVGYADLLVQEEATDKIIVSTMRDEEKTASYSCELEEGMLKVNPGNVDIRISIFGGDKTFRKGDIEKDLVMITVPCNMHFEVMKLCIGAGKARFKNNSTTYERAEIEVGAGKVSMDELNVEGHVDVETGAGHVELQNFKSKTADFECGVGSMVLKGAVEGDIKLDCGVGSIEMYLDAEEPNYNYNISCAVGTVLINGMKRGGMFATQSTMCNPNAKGNISMNCGVGKIELLTQKRIVAEQPKA